MFLQTIAEEKATGEVAEIYNRQKAQNGFVMEASKCFTARPDLLAIYTAFVDKVRSGFSLGMREWRLITLVAARQVPSTYCSYVYSKLLIDDLGSKDKVLAVQRNFHSAGLSGKDVEMLAYAEKIARNASEVGQADIDRLRQAGFSDQQICDIALCASFRCFVGRFFDAMGAGPEAVFFDDDEDFRAAMTVGRRYSTS